MKPIDYVSLFVADMLAFVLIFWMVIGLSTAAIGGRPVSGLVIQPPAQGLLLVPPEHRLRTPSVLSGSLSAESNSGGDGSFPIFDPELDADRTRNPPLLL